MRLGMRSAVAMGLVASVWLAVQRGPQAQEAGEPRTTSGSPAAAMSEKARRAEMLRLRTRIAKAKNTNAAFWRDITRLEQLGPKEWRIAVVQHPGARMVYTYRKVGDLAVADDHLALGPYELVVAQQAALRGQDAGSVAFATVWSSRLPSSGWMNASVGFRSAPDAVVIDVMSIQPHPSAAMSTPRSWPPDSFMKVDFVFLNAFR